MKISGHAHLAGFDPVLLELVSLRASQINGCSFCLDMHTKELRAKGVSEQMLYLLGVWREVPSLYSTREKAALAWTEALTKLGRPFEQVENQFTKSHRGSGLGLAITSSLVALHGGAMRIRSREGHGTVVSVRFPVGSGALPGDEAAAQSAA